MPPEWEKRRVLVGAVCVARVVRCFIGRVDCLVIMLYKSGWSV